tara:strand:+ start:297 stop:632 length:336 start_codon:yes stop_codon:yes gene_type:complete
MALMKFKTEDTALADIIVEVTVPITLSAVAVDRGTIATSDIGGASTLEIEWGTNWASVAEATALMQEMLDAGIEAAVADPYAIPVLSEICKAGEYLEPSECKSFTTYTYTT